MKTIVSGVFILGVSLRTILPLIRRVVPRIASIFSSVYNQVTLSRNFLLDWGSLQGYCEIFLPVRLTYCAFTMSMSYWFFSNDRIVFELNDDSLSQYMISNLKKIFTACRMLTFMTIIVRDATGWPNLSTAISKCFPAVEKNYMWISSPSRQGMGVTPISGFFGCLSYSPIHTLFSLQPLLTKSYPPLESNSQVKSALHFLGRLYMPYNVPSLLSLISFLFATSVTIFLQS